MPTVVIASPKGGAGKSTAAIILEPVQGEGGCRATPEEDLRWMRQMADEHGVLLIFDEVQCGMGRTGKLWAHEWAGMAPDIMAVAKALGGGFPIGACLATAEAAKGMTVGVHGSTFGGNPMAMAVANEAFDMLSDPALLENVNQVAGYFVQQLHGLQERYPDVIVDIRGRGLFWAIELVQDRGTKAVFDPKLKMNERVKKEAYARGLGCYPMGGTIDGRQGDHVLLAPPYVATAAQIDAIVTAVRTAGVALSPRRSVWNRQAPSSTRSPNVSVPA